MVYVQDSRLRIRDMLPEDGVRLTEEEIRQGWIHASQEKHRMRLKHRQEGKAVVLTAEYEGEPAGYVSVYFHPEQGPFAGEGIPEIVDLAVLEKYRRRGIGNQLLETAEQIAAAYGRKVYLGVGLHSGYGSAQRLYIHRGYFPDGSGVWYKDRVCPPYSPCCNDDDLVLYLFKSLETL